MYTMESYAKIVPARERTTGTHADSDSGLLWLIWLSFLGNCPIYETWSGGNILSTKDTSTRPELNVWSALLIPITNSTNNTQGNHYYITKWGQNGPANEQSYQSKNTKDLKKEDKQKKEG